MAGITESKHILMIIGLILVTSLYILCMIIVLFRKNIRNSNTSREIALLKMDLLSKQAHFKNLIDDPIYWSHQYLQEFERIRYDGSIMKLIVDTDLALTDDTTVKRFYLRDETVEFFEKLDNIKRYERKLFGDGVLDRVER